MVSSIASSWPLDPSYIAIPMTLKKWQSIHISHWNNSGFQLLFSLGHRQFSFTLAKKVCMPFQSHSSDSHLPGSLGLFSVPGCRMLLHCAILSPLLLFCFTVPIILSFLAPLLLPEQGSSRHALRQMPESLPPIWLKNKILYGSYITMQKSVIKYANS